MYTLALSHFVLVGAALRLWKCGKLQELILVLGEECLGPARQRVAG